MLKHETKPTWGLVFSGGAAYGLANAGVWEVLERENLRPDCIAGSSMGAIVGAIAAMGCNADDLRDLAGKLRMLHVARLSERPLRGGLHGGILQQNLHELLSPLFGNACIGDCKIPFVCVAGRVKSPIAWHKILKEGFTDYAQKNVEKFVFPPETLLMDALTASSAIPVVFSPAVIDGQEFIDLVHFGAIPARTLRAEMHPDVVIGTDTNPRYEGVQDFLPASWREFLDKGHASLEESRASCDLVLEPAMPAAMFRFDKAMEFWKAGEIAAKENMEKIQKLLRKDRRNK